MRHGPLPSPWSGSRQAFCAPGPESFGRHGGHRHSHGHGYGPRGGPAVGGPPRGRRRRGDVRLALLTLLSDEPRNGYQLMQAIEERTAGRWRPSPGSVYPTLAQLEDEGLIRSTERDEQKVFELTEAGQQFVADHDETGPFAHGDGPGERGRHELRALTRQVIMAARQVIHAGDEGQLERAGQTLAQTRRSLYQILADEPGAGDPSVTPRDPSDTPVDPATDTPVDPATDTPVDPATDTPVDTPDRPGDQPGGAVADEQ